MKKFNTIDHRELHAASQVVHDVMDGDGFLSGYIGSLEQGGRHCAALEHEWGQAFKVQNVVAVNSATSGLLAACMAIGIHHDDEVIVSPYTMSATAAAPALLGAKLVFADIEADTFCLDPVEVSNAINGRTKAVIVTNLFGHPACLHELRELCDAHGIYLIEDNAQAIFAKERGVYAGTVGHIGVFSLNVHKHLQVGEGGICVTDDYDLAVTLREAMNHGEMRGGRIGLNLRMTEVTAAMARRQLAKAPNIMKSRKHIAEMITSCVAGLPIMPPTVREDCEHSYYCWAGLLTRPPLSDDLPSPWRRGYLHPLYSLPALRQRISLPVVEEVESRIVLVEVCSIDPTDDEIIVMVEALGRVI